MTIYRTRFAKDIICEFVPPVRFSSKAIIFCGGLPSPPARGSLLLFWAKLGYWSFSFRYRGTWESSGRFLKDSPVKDILDVVGSFKHEFKDIETGKKFKVVFKSIFLIGSSFGGAAALVASKDARVSKVVALSPVTNWTKRSPGEPRGQHFEYLKTAFGPVYRFTKRDWHRLYSGELFNPIDKARDLPGGKVLILHAKDDKIVISGPVAQFAKTIGASFKLYKNGGHFGLSSSQKAGINKRIQAFLKAKKSV